MVTERSATRWTTCLGSSSCGRRAVAGSPPQLVGHEAVVGVRLDGDDLIVSTTRAKDVAVLLPQAARDLGVHLVEVRPLDDSLESLFRELVR